MSAIKHPSYSLFIVLSITAIIFNSFALAQEDNKPTEQRTFSSRFKQLEAQSYAAAVSWYVEKTLDMRMPSTPRALGLTYVRKPRPTTDDFHNSFAVNWEIRNKDVYLATRKRSGYGRGEIGVEEYIRPFDLNLLEIGQMNRETTKTIKKDGKLLEVDEFYPGKPLVPIGLRRKFKSGDVKALKKIATLYDIEIKPEDVLYVREFRDVKGGKHTGMAIKLSEKVAKKTGRKAQFLFD